ncbi:Fc.00g026560.m01.CDS01 [Cosmosporella sp. VM-42]
MRAEQTLFDRLPPELNYNSTGWLTYDESRPKPETAIVEAYNAYHDMELFPYDEMKLLPAPDRVVQLEVMRDNIRDGASYGSLKKIAYTTSKVPTLHKALPPGDPGMNWTIYGEYSHPFVLKKGEVVQLVVDSFDTSRNSFHLHSHSAQAIHRSVENASTY